jgi:hypothetical protein
MAVQPVAVTVPVVFFWRIATNRRSPATVPAGRAMLMELTPMPVAVAAVWKLAPVPGSETLDDRCRCLRGVADRVGGDGGEAVVAVAGEGNVGVGFVSV